VEEEEAEVVEVGFVVMLFKLSSMKESTKASSFSVASLFAAKLGLLFVGCWGLPSSSILVFLDGAEYLVYSLST
jgi:hypothetical protein